MVTNDVSLSAVANLPKEIFKAQNDLNEKLVKLNVEEKVQNQTSPERLLDVFV